MVKKQEKQKLKRFIFVGVNPLFDTKYKRHKHKAELRRMKKKNGNK